MGPSSEAVTAVVCPRQSAPESLDQALREYVELWEEGAPGDVIAARLRHYPLAAPIRSAGQLGAFIASLVKRGEPAWFCEWSARERASRTAVPPPKPCPVPSFKQLPAPLADRTSTPPVAPLVPQPSRSRPYMRPRSVSDDVLPAFLDDFRKRFENGDRVEQMIGPLRKYFSNPKVPLTNARQIYAFTRFVVESNRAPKDFIRWWRTDRLKVPRPMGPSKGAPKIAAYRAARSSRYNGNGVAPKPRSIAASAKDPALREVAQALDTLRRHNAIPQEFAWKTIVAFAQR